MPEPAEKAYNTYNASSPCAEMLYDWAHGPLPSHCPVLPLHVRHHTIACQWLQVLGRLHASCTALPPSAAASNNLQASWPLLCAEQHLAELQAASWLLRV